MVASNVGGIPEIIDDGVNGVLAEKPDPEIFAQIIMELLSDSEKAAMLAQNLHNKYELLYKSLIHGEK